MPVDCEKMYGYIYITENLINHKKYIGQHKSESFDAFYKGSGVILRKAFEKYGWDNFKTEIIEWCSSGKDLNEREIYWIDFYDAVNSPMFYNISFGGAGSPLPKELNPMYGKHHSEDTRELISIKVKKYYTNNKNPKCGTSLSEHTKFLLRKANLGKKASEETRAKMSKSRTEVNLREHRVGINARNARKVRCIETGHVFGCLDDANKFISSGNVKDALRERSKTKYAGGYHWEYVD